MNLPERCGLGYFQHALPVYRVVAGCRRVDCGRRSRVPATIAVILARSGNGLSSVLACNFADPESCEPVLQHANVLPLVSPQLVRGSQTVRPAWDPGGVPQWGVPTGAVQRVQAGLGKVVNGYSNVRELAQSRGQSTPSKHILRR
jgi:hypothetical protein